MELQAGQQGRGVCRTSSIQQHDGGLSRGRLADQLIDGVDLFEYQVAAEVRADLRPQLIVAGDEQYRELGSLGGERSFATRRFRRCGLTFPCCALHRYPPRMPISQWLLHRNLKHPATSERFSPC